VTIDVSPATREDLAAIVDLLYEIDRYYGDDATEPPDQRAATVQHLVLSDHPVAHILLVRVDGGPAIGLAAYSFLWPARGATHSLYLKELYVRDEHRHTGAGRALMTRLVQLAADAGCSRIEWTADENNPTAQHFYAALGAKTHDGKHHYRLNAESYPAAVESWNQPHQR
jgi:GNAT superfamily N-acetyltransferase